MSKLRIDRIIKRSDFVRAARNGASFRTRSLVLQVFHPSPQDAELSGDILCCRAGFTVTKKVGNAVVRNRIKRRFRALAADMLPELGRNGSDYVLIGRKAALTTPYDELKVEFMRAIQEVHAS
ncbi:MAG: ribonuclease P protein component [Rickettsiales bacterium]|nr:ribonuclease P protein component [Rickettsiales bacterium]